MSTNYTDNEKEIAHPLEDVFNLEENTTVVTYTERKTDLVPHVSFDEKDNEIESQLQDIYDMSLEAFENQQEDGEIIDPKYRARNAEVAAVFLKTALEAVQSKSNLKQHKDKIVVRETGKTTNNNVILADREDIMKALRAGKSVDAIADINTIEGDYEAQDDT